MITIRREIVRTARAEGVGPEAAARIADMVCATVRRRHGPGREYIPAPDVRERNRRITEARKNGATHSEIAKAEGVHRSTVSRVVAEGFGSPEWEL